MSNVIIHKSVLLYSINKVMKLQPSHKDNGSKVYIMNK